MIRYHAVLVFAMMLWVQILIIFSVSSYSVKGEFLDDSNEKHYDGLPSLKLYKFKDHAYYFGSIVKATYFTATQFCNYHDMKLLSIESEEENNFIKDTYKQILPINGELVFWTSGTKLSGNQWIWLSSGNSLLYTKWAPGQPETRGETCIDARLNAKENNLLWHDNPCEVEEYFVCEATLKPASNFNPNGSSCVNFIDVRTT